MTVAIMAVGREAGIRIVDNAPVASAFHHASCGGGGGSNTSTGSDDANNDTPPGQTDPDTPETNPPDTDALPFSGTITMGEYDWFDVQSYYGVIDVDHQPLTKRRLFNGSQPRFNGKDSSQGPIHFAVQHHTNKPWGTCDRLWFFVVIARAYSISSGNVLHTKPAKLPRIGRIQPRRSNAAGAV